MAREGDSELQQMQQMQAAMLAMQSANMTPAAVNLSDMPGVDPNMAQAYMTMLQYLTAQQSLGASGMGMPPMPFPSMAPPYTPAMPADATISVAVEGMKFQYQLTEDDLSKVFSRYGGVKHIRVEEAGAAAQITFFNMTDAQAAMQDLNGKVLNGLEGTLRIALLNQTQNPMLQPPYPLPFTGVPGFPPFPNTAGWPPAAPGGPPPGGNAPNAMLPAGDGKASSKGVRKYTCRFIIGIENDKDFQVARRVIGAKGANMKRIVKHTEAKLRLRGVGSGYFEGTGQKESSEPLQLCISCTNGEHYKMAVRQVEELLKKVYEEYNVFCRENGRPVPDLQINFSENQLVYSAARSAGAGPAAFDDDDDRGMASPSPKKGSRNRRVRNKEREGPSGEVERGEPGPNAPPVEDIERQIDARNEARRACNFAEADRIREALHSQGVALMDEPGGRGRGHEVTTWRYWRD